MRDEGDERGLVWKLPQVKSQQLGKLGPAFGIGAGCGVGLGVGLLGGVGFGPGIPGLQVGIGFGAGCGVGLGFGYGMGRGVAFDDKRRYSNVGNLSDAPVIVPSHKDVGYEATDPIETVKGYMIPRIRDDIGALVDDLVINAKKLIRATSREIERWRR